MKEILAGIIYYFMLITSTIFWLLCVRTKVYYEDDKKQSKKIKGKAIIIANHRSPLDGYAIAQKYFTRKIYYVIADFFKDKLKFLAPLVRFSGGIIVDRENFSFDFFEESKRLLYKDKAVLLFPEGRISLEYEPARFVYSYIALAIQSGAKIIPIASDFNYGFLKRVHIIIGNSIDLSQYGPFESLKKEKLKEINENIYQHFLFLYYQMKKKKYEKFNDKYAFNFPEPGDIIRISVTTHYHYGVFLSRDEVVQFGNAINRTDEPVKINTVSLNDFCGGKIPEVRVLSKKEKRHKRNIEDITQYARSCLGQQGYNFATNNCYDFANRIIFK